MRFNPLIQQIKHIVDSGAIGSILSFNGNLGMSADFNKDSRLFDPELGGGSLYDLGVYPLSLIQYLSDGDWDINAQCLKSSTGVDIHLCAQLANTKGQAQILSSFMANTDSNFHIYGTKARIEIKGPIYRPYKFQIEYYKSYDETKTSTAIKNKPSKLNALIIRSFPISLTIKVGSAFLKQKLKSGSQYILYRKNAYQYEANEAYNVIVSGNIESDIMPHKDSIETLKLIEKY